MIVDAIILILAFAFMAGGPWLLWNLSAQALEDWRADR